MPLPKDKIQHLTWGAGLALIVACTVLAARASPALAIALASAALGVGVELYQRARNEGEPSWLDALATATPGLLLAGIVLLAGVG
ncbi:MAG: hypothetical protein U1F25_13595 [Rubrivivax sp.]